MFFCLGRAEKELCFSVPAQSELSVKITPLRQDWTAPIYSLIAFSPLRIYRHLGNLVFEAGISNLFCKLELCGRN